MELCMRYEIFDANWLFLECRVFTTQMKKWPSTIICQLLLSSWHRSDRRIFHSLVLRLAPLVSDMLTSTLFNYYVNIPLRRCGGHSFELAAETSFSQSTRHRFFYGGVSDWSPIHHHHHIVTHRHPSRGEKGSLISPENDGQGHHVSFMHHICPASFHTGFMWIIFWLGHLSPVARGQLVYAAACL